MVEGARDLSGASLMRALIPFLRAPLSASHHLPKASPLNTLVWGVRVQTVNLGDANIQSVLCGLYFFHTDEQRMGD